MAIEVSIEQLKQARQDGAMVIDVRNGDEYAAGHVAGFLTGCTFGKGTYPRELG